jgi:uncharacterized protein (DUF433 family)
MDYQQIIMIEPGKRGGRPCIRHMRIAALMCLDGSLTAGLMNKSSETSLS